MQKIVVDTDIGDDIDDALALQMVIRSPDLNLLGISTVFTRSDLRSCIARELVALHGLDVPVYTGSSRPISGEWDGHLPCQYDEAYAGHQNDGSEDDAVKFLIDSVSRNPGEVTVLAIGMLTNVAKAILRSEEFRCNVKRIVLMGGMISNHYVEWNIRLDPEAAYTVFHSGIPIVMVGLDVTMSCKLSLEDVYRHLQSPGDSVQQFLTSLIRRWADFSGNRQMILHDPLAVITLIEPSSVQTRNLRVGIETQGTFTRGMTYCYNSPFGEAVPDLLPEIEVCVEVDRDKVIRLVKQWGLK